MKKLRKVAIVLAMLVFMVGCSKDKGAMKESDPLLLATTTSTENSGLLSAILPDFTKKTGIEVKVIAVGTGKALEMGRQGEVDVLLVHAKSSEETFVEEGHGKVRYDVMYNDFVIIGPEADPAKIKEEAPNDVVKALIKLSEKKEKFVSRGDDSGTHKKELSLWKEASIEPQGDWYIAAGKGMGDTIIMADELEGYTMADRATYLSFTEKADLQIVCEKDSQLFNQYGVIPVNPEKSETINKESADAFVEWLLSKETAKIIGEFGKEKYGQPLFIPNGKNVE